MNHHGREVTVVLDSHTEKMTASEGHQHLHMDPAVYFGGIEKAHTGKGLFICLCDCIKIMYVSRGCPRDETRNTLEIP